MKKKDWLIINTMATVTVLSATGIVVIMASPLVKKIIGVLSIDEFLLFITLCGFSAFGIIVAIMDIGGVIIDDTLL